MRCPLRDHAGQTHSHTHDDRRASCRGVETVEHLIEHLRPILTPSAAIVCVGNDLNGDDGAGVVIARQIDGRVPWKVFDTQTVPESFLMKIVHARPDSVLLIDALDFAAVPGAVDVVPGDSIAGQGPSTHGPAPLAFLELLQMMHPCRTAVLGIQPESGEIGDGLSEPVAEGVQLIVRALLGLAGETEQNRPMNGPPA